MSYSTHNTLSAAEFRLYFDSLGCNAEAADIFLVITTAHFQNTKVFFDCAIDLYLS